MIRTIINFFMKTFFNLLYHGLAGSYDLVARIVSLGHWNDWVYSILPLLEDGPVVELGHGPGHLQKRLLQAGRPVYGLDESRQMSHLARRRLAGLPFRLIRADARRLPFSSGAIPLFAATFPSDFIFQPETLAEIHRTLTSSGKLIILLAVWPGGSSLIEKCLRLLSRITGESPSHNIDFQAAAEKYTLGLFEPEIIHQEYQQTRLLVMILRKTA